MKLFTTLSALALSTFLLTACDEDKPTPPAPPTAMEQQRQQAVQDTQNSQLICSECNNIKFKRQALDKPGVVGYVAFLSDTGSPVLYATTKGKCTSSGKRLENNKEWAHDDHGREMYYEGSGEYGRGVYSVTDGPSEDGSYGQSDSYIYCQTTDGAYIQWSGKYLFSDRPIQLTMKPVAVYNTNNPNEVHGQ